MGTVDEVLVPAVIRTREAYASEEAGRLGYKWVAEIDEAPLPGSKYGDSPDEARRLLLENMPDGFERVTA